MADPPAGTVGAVLCGGASRRMGRDKALLEVDGRPMAQRVAEALRAGGCDDVLAVGGDPDALRALGLRPVADRWAGEGPLGALATALVAAEGASALVLAPCDLLDPAPTVVTALLAALHEGGDEVDAVAGEVADRVEWILSAWHPTGPLVAAVVALVDGGARRLDAVAAVARRAPCPAIGAAEVRDADVPSDLSRE